jgi:hypothetical protein
VQALIEVILPVFLVAGFGYVAVWRGLFSDAAVDGLMRFTQSFAIPCLLFRAISTLDLGQEAEAPLLLSFYAGALSGFAAGLLGARYLFRRGWEDAVAVGFTLPITERAYGTEALAGNYAIIAIHAPVCYGLGITAMEVARAGLRAGALARQIGAALGRNPLVIAIVLGLGVNLAGLTVPVPLGDALDLMARAALPAALFGLGGVLCRYRPEGDMRLIGYVVAVALVLHPSITWTLGRAFALETSALRSAVLTAAMAPGVNAYIFATLYGRARRVAASAVLIATALSVLTVWVWLKILP